MRYLIYLIIFFSDSGESYGEICDLSKFKCANGQCISKRLRCNGRFDCLDSSDEQSCNVTKTSCQFGSCSQICIPKKNFTHSCHCALGYSVTLPNKTCQAIGKNQFLLCIGYLIDFFLY